MLTYKAALAWDAAPVGRPRRVGAWASVCVIHVIHHGPRLAALRCSLARSRVVVVVVAAAV